MASSPKGPGKKDTNPSGKFRISRAIEEQLQAHRGSTRAHEKIPSWESEGNLSPEETVTAHGDGHLVTSPKGKPLAQDAELNIETVITGKTDRLHADFFGANEKLFDAPPSPFSKFFSTFENRKTLQVLAISFFCLILGIFFWARLGTKVSNKTSLAVESEPSGAKIFLNGDEKGSTPLRLTDLEANEEYLLQLQKDGFESFQTEIVIPRVRNQKLRFDLVPNSSFRKTKSTFLPVEDSNSPFGYLTLESSPGVAIVYLNRRRLDRVTPISKLKVSPGEYTLVFKNPQTKEKIEKQVEVKRGKTEKVRVKFR